MDGQRLRTEEVDLGLGAGLPREDGRGRVQRDRSDCVAIRNPFAIDRQATNEGNSKTFEQCFLASWAESVPLGPSVDMTLSSFDKCSGFTDDTISPAYRVPVLGTYLRTVRDGGTAG
ncbi:hypothetical protein [Nocardia sienata]|uniref:hypothetical protein n=1 Tax=Nocardia sienata TaxID=248552 RepID=UPI000A01433D|nr:hypothetical protein [Nocardia sienata]